MHLSDRATSVLACLLAERALQKGPLILIGHSLGGLVIKQLLHTAESEGRNRAEASDLIRRVTKVVFLATPHTGSDLAGWGDRLRILIRPSAATASLLRNDPNLRDLNLWYRDWANASKINHLILVETQPLHIFGMIVKPDSSDPGLAGRRPVPIDANHIEISKPCDRSSAVYVQIRAFIERPISPSGGAGELPGQKAELQVNELGKSLDGPKMPTSIERSFVRCVSPGAGGRTPTREAAAPRDKCSLCPSASTAVLPVCTSSECGAAFESRTLALELQYVIQDGKQCVFEPDDVRSPGSFIRANRLTSEHALNLRWPS
jgi:hypothetical protein